MQTTKTLITVLSELVEERMFQQKWAFCSCFFVSSRIHIQITKVGQDAKEVGLFMTQGVWCRDKLVRALVELVMFCLVLQSSLVITDKAISLSMLQWIILKWKWCYISVLQIGAVLRGDAAVIEAAINKTLRKKVVCSPRKSFLWGVLEVLKRDGWDIILRQVTEEHNVHINCWLCLAVALPDCHFPKHMV